jgi:hypothetical protein
VNDIRERMAGAGQCNGVILAQLHCLPR